VNESDHYDVQNESIFCIFTAVKNIEQIHMMYFESECKIERWKKTTSVRSRERESERLRVQMPMNGVLLSN